MKKFETLKEFKEYIIENGVCPNGFWFKDTMFEMESYDLTGKQVTYTNLKKGQDLFIEWNNNRYKEWDDIKDVYITLKETFRLDIVYRTAPKDLPRMDYGLYLETINKGQ